MVRLAGASLQATSSMCERRRAGLSKSRLVVGQPLVSRSLASLWPELAPRLELVLLAPMLSAARDTYASASFPLYRDLARNTAKPPMSPARSRRPDSPLGSGDCAGSARLATRWAVPISTMRSSIALSWCLASASTTANISLPMRALSCEEAVAFSGDRLGWGYGDRLLDLGAPAGVGILLSIEAFGPRCLVFAKSPNLPPVALVGAGR
jgi:hypothetical protein